MVSGHVQGQSLRMFSIMLHPQYIPEIDTFTCFSALCLADNVLFHGDVLQDEVKGKNAKAIAASNEKVKNTPGIDHTLLTVRDGLMVIRKM